MRLPRSSGVLLHITSLPGPHGIGDLGPKAFAFVDFLCAAGQGIWQLLPLHPPAEGNSPYSSLSAFAGNPLLISIDRLAEQGLLDQAALRLPLPSDARLDRVDYAAVAAWKRSRLHQAFETHTRDADAQARAAVDRYAAEQQHWLTPFARFAALVEHFGSPDWSTWPAEIARGEPAAIAAWDQRLAVAIERVKFWQFLFDQQWTALKAYANERHVRMYGDMPIFVAYESADVWQNQPLFALDEKGRREVVAGVPPDYFSATGQLWGNPLYRWDVMAERGYGWWVQRFANALRQFDLLRVDHFRGFEAYWEVPADAETAEAGQWQPGPGTAVFDAAQKTLGPLPIVAEDLGLITDAVHQLREQLNFPGMRVLQFGFDTIADDFHRPEAYPENSVVYTGTHDNDTLVGWLERRDPPPEKEDPLQPLLKGKRPAHWELIDAVLRSAADTAIVPLQDLLGLDNAARMNIPGQAAGNWTWRVRADQLTPEIAFTLHQLTEQFGRGPADTPG